MAERLLSGLLKEHGRHHVSTAGETWYPHVCRLLRIKHHLLSLYEKSIIERKMQYIKDRTDSLQKKKCKLKHIINWSNLFANFHDREVKIK